MLGKASDINTWLVKEKVDEDFDITLNKALEKLGDKEIISIQFRATPDEQGVAWFIALIIYKE